MAPTLTSQLVKNQLPNEMGVAAERRSLRLLWWIPASPIIGFVAAELFLSESWPLWQVVPLAVLLASPFAAGAFYGAQAIRHGRRRAWLGLLAHVMFALVALVMPISESLTL
jgi:hypothetical protein